MEPRPPSPIERRRVLVFGVLRSLTVSTVLTVAYFVLPLDQVARLPFVVIIVGGVVILAAAPIHQVRSILRSAHPATRAVEALALTVPLFLLLFATTYFLMAQADSGSFNLSGLTRSDTLYFTITVFTTVGFGDIVATSHAARSLVTVQMVLDLILLGAVVRVFIVAVRVARSSPATPV